MSGLAVTLSLAYLVIVLCWFVADWFANAPYGTEDEDGFHEERDDEGKH